MTRKPVPMHRAPYRFMGRTTTVGGVDLYTWERPMIGDSRVDQITCPVDYFWNHGKTRERRAYYYPEVDNRFRKDTAEHQMTVLYDDGLYRHIRFKKPGTGMYSFSLVTWPGHLAITGDMGAYVFARIEDMFEFFVSGSGVNPQYWAEKLQAGEARSYSQEKFEAGVKDLFDQYVDTFDLPEHDRHNLWRALEQDVLCVAYDEHEATEAASRFTWRAQGILRYADFTLDDLFDRGLDDFTTRFLWCCFAIRFGVQRYQAERTVR